MLIYHLRQQRLPYIFNKEQGLILLALVLFVLSPFVLRSIDMSAAPLDAGIISAIILAVLAFLVFKAITWWLVQNIWPVLGQYSKEHFDSNFKSLLSWQKIIIYLSFYLLLLFGFIATLAAVL